MLYIKVLDRFNKPLKGRTVRIESTGFAGNSTKTTNENGDVEFNMRPGNFRVRVTNKDFWGYVPHLCDNRAPCVMM